MECTAAFRRRQRHWMGQARNESLTGLCCCVNVTTRYYTSPRLMKRRAADPGDHLHQQALASLAQAIAGLRDAGLVAAFLQDLCTPAELEALTDRWRVVPLLLEGVPYREIHDRTLVSVTTIGRVARTLDHGTGGYAAAIDRCASQVGFPQPTDIS